MNKVETQKSLETLVPDQLKVNEILNWDCDKREWREGDIVQKRTGDPKNRKDQISWILESAERSPGEAHGVDRPFTPTGLTVHDSRARIDI